ncbi:CDP-glycerol--glycerophosphate glycerophosphotransferase [Patulibacter americanus]|uniref:CDP-glycerol--glycerophosphate glycerophosphotransferase n=1 Tax=Patulibacter americanus TaxID=588672 RepID=UPI0003B475BC|nr:CDP-glycerol--glycerophosphate glycerophosphotransferase [Patulibacter americanus]
MRLVYNAFAGRFADSPRALYEELVRRGGDHEHVWLADPKHVDAFPEGVQTAILDSPEGIAALEACDALIANTHTEVEWEKKPGAVYLQTWHGTPLKRIHWDVLWAPEGRLERLQRDVDRWDLLVSPNAASTPLLRGAFRYEGEVLETGYPRNDVLSGPDKDAIRARVRERLGIAEGTRAVLYAPTWRDDVVFAGGDEPLELDLDVERMAAELGDDHCLLLRLHYMLTGRLKAFGSDAIKDVSFYPDISELYLAADVLMTDYSSTMFDFAVTAKPELFFVPDLETYRDTTRGFYFDFEPVAPGPLLADTDGVIAALRDLPAVTAQNADRYATFRERFAHLEDGHATERVLDRLLRTQGDRPA